MRSRDLEDLRGASELIEGVAKRREGKCGWLGSHDQVWRGLVLAPTGSPTGHSEYVSEPIVL